MNASSSPSALPTLDVARRIHQICEQFEDAWSECPRPQLTAFLENVDGPERAWLLAELLSLELELRHTAGEEPTEMEYLQLFPSERDIVAAAFVHCSELKEHDSRGLARAASTSKLISAAPKIEGYEILEVLGRGGMGIVYKARDQRLKRLVALKLILAGDHADVDHLARFRTEAEMVARLQHPHIVQIFDIGEQNGHPYIAFEFIEGQTLADFVGRAPQPPRIAAELLEALARTMDYAHQQGIVHRDLKPSNTLLARKAAVSSESKSPSRNSQLSSATNSNAFILHANSLGLVPKITDFGLAKDLSANLDRTSTGTIIGTPLYMSPEQADGRIHAIGPPSDLYSLGAILYLLLTGRPPLQGTSTIETLKMAVSAEPVAPSQLQPHLPRDLETICLKCLRKEPSHRYDSAGALASDLRRFLNDEPILARASGRIEKTWRWCRRNAVVASLLATVLLVLVIGVCVSSYFAYTASMTAEEALAERDRAEANAQRARQRAYVSDLREVQRAWESNLFIHFLDLLDAQRPSRTDNVDVRGFEWYYWQRIARSCGIIGHHRAAVRSVCFSPDGKRLVSSSSDGMVKVWGIEAGLEALTITGHTRFVRSLCMSPDGKKIVTGSDDRTVKVWNAETGRLKLSYAGHTLSSVMSVCISPDGKQILSCSEDGTMNVCDAETGTETSTFTGHSKIASSVCFSADGKRFVSGGNGSKVKVWNARTCQELLSLEGHTQDVWSVSISQDGKYLASASFDKTVKVWNAESGQLKFTLNGHTQAVMSVCFSPDGKQIASGSYDGTVKVWDAATGQELYTLKGHTMTVYSVCFSPDGTQIASGSADGTLRIWDASGASPALTFDGHQSQVTSVAASSNGRWLASAGGNWDGIHKRFSAGELRLWEPSTGHLLYDMGGHSSGVTCAIFSPDSQYLASGSGVWDESKKRYQSAEVGIWDPTSGTLLHRLQAHESVVLSLAISPDSQFLASGDIDGGVVVQQLPHGQNDFRLPGSSVSVTTLAFSPDGRFLAAGCSNSVVRIWNLSDRSEVASLSFPVVVSSVVFRPDGKQLAVAGYTRELQLYDTTTYSEVRRLQGHVGSLTHVAYSPDGRRIATASEDRSVRLWDSSSGQEMLTLNGHTSIVRSVHFSPDGQKLFSGGWDRTICLWDATPVN